MKFVLAITGPAGAGKSTIASKLAKQIDQCVNIDADLVKHMIVNGFDYAKTPEGIKQWELLGENIGSLAHNYFTAGYNVIINGYINEPAWLKIQRHIELTHKILLLPDVDTTIQRDAKRDVFYAMGDNMVKEHHDYFTNSSFFKDFTKLDTTRHTEDETVKQIIATLSP